MLELLIERLSDNQFQTIGTGYVLKDDYVQYEFNTLELPWRENQFQISCIPTGKYRCIKRKSDKYKKHFHVLDVPNRSLILIHHGNFHVDTLGCIIAGSDLKDINNDGFIDVVNSKKTMKKLLNILPNEFDLTIRNCFSREVNINL